MLISRTSQYAIQALICLSLHGDGRRSSVRDLARWLDVPSPYLAKILQTLCRDGLLDSSRGRQGGFGLRTSAAELSLLQVLAATEGEQFGKECLLGLKQCGDDSACPMHATWKPVKERLLAMLEAQTLASLAAAVGQGECRLTDLADSPLACVRRA